MNKIYTKEITWDVAILFWFLFASTNINQVLGNVYHNFLTTGTILLIIGITIFDKKLSISLINPQISGLKSILIAIGGYIILLLSSVFVIKFIDPTQANFASVLGLMSATPALAQSKIANWITFAIAVPWAETMLWTRALEFVCDLFHIQINPQAMKKVKYIIIIILFSFAFLIFHLTAKNISAVASLLITFLMMLISLIIVTYTGEGRTAVILHSIANGIAAAISLFSAGALTLGAIAT